MKTQKSTAATFLFLDFYGRKKANEQILVTDIQTPDEGPKN